MKTKLFALLFISYELLAQLPKGFVTLHTIEPSIKIDMHYTHDHNFVGKPIDGYKKSICIMTKETALALHKVQQQLKPFGLGLKLFDAYRPQRAVDHFVSWAKDIDDTKMKHVHYPNVDKKNLFRDGYIARRSGHSRGSTVDVTIIDLQSKKELDMGTPFDYFGVESHIIYPKLTTSQRTNRALLQRVMLSNGFKPLKEEWWHFTLKNEPFPNTYFDFVIK
jgi:D-alanyl-D-alanine dipeptidase